MLSLFKKSLPSVPQLVEKAKKIPLRLGKSDFSGTNGCLSKWKKHYNKEIYHM